MSFNSPFTGNVIQPTDVSFRNITLAEDTQLSWPINGNATDNYAARIMDVTASSAGLSLWMPPANQTSVGQDALIRNIGSNTFTVKDYAGDGTIISIAAGECKYIYITDNATEYGTWGNIAFGVGTSAPDAATLAGYGLLAMSSTLNQSHPTSGISNEQYFAATDRASAKIWLSGSGSVNLPSVNSLGDNWFILFKNNGTGSCTINCSSPDLIDGSSSKEYNPNESSFIICDGSGYITVGYGISSNFAFTAAVVPVSNADISISPSQAQAVLQELQGTLTSDVVITYPPVTNLYVISNQTTGAYTVSIKTPSGSPITVPQSNQATVVCDGINFFNANTVQSAGTSIALINGNVTSPSLNFVEEPATGVFRNGSGEFNTSILGLLRSTLSASGLSIIGSGTFSNGISGGTFS